MIWKLLPQICAFAVLTLTLVLDYWWTDRRKTQFKRGRRLLMLSVAALVLVSTSATYLDHRTAARREHELRLDNACRVVRAVFTELGRNFPVLQIKQGPSFGLANGLVAQQSQEADLALRILRVTKFHSLAFDIWGSRFDELRILGASGDSALAAAVGFYDALKLVEKHETELLDRILSDQDTAFVTANWRVLHSEYDRLRHALDQAGRAVAPLVMNDGRCADAERDVP